MSFVVHVTRTAKVYVLVLVEGKTNSDLFFYLDGPLVPFESLFLKIAFVCVFRAHIILRFFECAMKHLFLLFLCATSFLAPSCNFVVFVPPTYAS